MIQHKIQAIVFKKENKQISYLLLRRIPSRGGFWQPATGRVEKNETHLDAAKRELKEETGITKIKDIMDNIYEFKLDNLNSFEKVFGVEVENKTKVSLDKNLYPEHDEIRWCAFDEAINLLKWPQNKKALEELNSILTKLK